MTTTFAVASVGVVAVPAAHAFGGSITGVVRDTAGAPIAGATVSLQLSANAFYYPSFTATTDAIGAYTISGIGPGSFEVLAFAPGFAIRVGNAATFAAGTPVVIVGEETHTFDVALPRKNASMSGTLTNPDGDPIAGAMVRADYKGDSLPYFIPGFEIPGYFGFATTDAAGRYVLANLAPAPYTLFFSPQDFSTGPPTPSPYLEEWYPDSLVESGATPVELFEGVDTTIDAQLELGATISGRVTDPAGNPVAGVNVMTPANNTFGGVTTDANGMYTMIGIPPGDLAYVVASPEGTNLLSGFYGGATNFDTATHLQVGLAQVIVGIDIQLTTPGNVNVATFSPDGSLASAGFVPCIAPGMPVVVPSPIPGWGPLIQCTSGGQVNVINSDGGAFRIPIGTYNAVSAEGTGGFGVTSLNPSAVASFTLTADTTIDCVFHLGGAASCTPADPDTNDGDGLPASVEDAAPNNGDGNNDGIRDATQSNVASLPAAIGGGYVTLVVADGLHITHATVIDQTSVTQQVETGAIGIRVNGLAVGGTADITVLRSTGGAATEVWALDHQIFQYTAVPAELSGSTINAHIVDGGVFDTESLSGPFYYPPDGAVSTFLIPVIPDRTPPTITCPSPDPIFAFQDFSATLTATVTDSGSGVVIPPNPFPPPPGFPVPPPFTQSISTFVAGPGSVTFTASDKAGNTATATCSYTVVDDGDGVPPFIETGDGNGDGNADALQPNVAKATGYTLDGLEPIVIASPTGTQLTNVFLSPGQYYPTPPGPLQSGVVSSTITGITPGQTISVDLIQTAARGNTFLQYTGPGWVPLPSTFNGARVTVSLIDGGLGDSDGAINGSIGFSGAVATGETTPPTITCGATPAFRQFEQFAVVTATVFDAGSGVATPFLTLPADTSTLGTYSVTFVASDLAGNQASQSCPYNVVDDGDGVPAEVENAAPNNGDGNLDGILDSVQSTVASLPQPIGGGYTTILSTLGNGALTNVSASGFTGTPPIPSNLHLESGLYRFTIHGSFGWAYLIRSIGATNWVLYSPIQGSWQQVSTFINDGGFGDADGVVNGQVSYVVALAIPDTTPPTITCPSAPSFLLNKPGATLTARVSDSDSGVVKNTVKVAVPTSTVGANTVAVTAADRAGNVNTVSCPYDIGVKLDHLSSPDPAQTTNVKAGRPIPITWRAVDFFGRGVSDPSHFLGVDATASSCVRGHDDGLGSVRDRGLRYLGNGRWEFDWMPPTKKGCYTLKLSLTGASKTAHIKVK